MQTLFFISCILLACLTPVWYAAGRAVQGVGAPSITGILAAGLATGPHAVGLLRNTHLVLLRDTIEGVCLSYIAMLAGTELRAGDVQRTQRLVLTLVMSISLASWTVVSLGFCLLKDYLPLFSGLSGYEIFAVSNMLGVLAIARSPAAAISVLKETKANGPFSSVVMAVVVAKDIILFIAFAAAFGIMKQVMMDVDDTVDATVDATVDRTFTRTVIRSLGLPALDILTSMTVGSLAVLCLASPYFLFPRLSALHQRRTLTTTTTASQPQQTQQQQAQQQQQQQQQPTAILKMVHRLLLESPRVAFPVLAAGCLRFLADAFGTEVLLTCVSAGVTLGHLEPSWIQPAGHGSLSSQPTHAPLFNWSGALPVISTIFFGLVGANLQVDKIGRNLGPALLLFGFRLVGVWIGCFVGGRVGGVGLLQTPLTRKYLWMTMITQAGIALGLTRTVVSRYPASPWAQDFEALMAGQVIANLVAGPPALRQALRLAGEGAIEVQDDDAVHLSFNQHRDGAEITQRSAIQNKAGGGGGPEA